MDLLSFGAALSRTQRLTMEKSMIDTLNMRLAHHAGKKDWKKWNRQMKRMLRTQAGTPEQLEGLVNAGKLGKKKRRRKKKD